MKNYRTLVFLTTAILSATLFTSCLSMSPFRTVTSVTSISYENPQWAPPYYSGARYYYIPDLELYYDLSSREYIFLLNGRWHFSPYLPAMYRDFDLDNCFSIVLNVRVYKPWLHHHYYVSHYPRYYYRDYYDHSNIPYVRAYNENVRRAIYWKENERHRARTWDDENVRDNRRFRYSKDDRMEQRNRTHSTTSETSFGGSRRNSEENQQSEHTRKRTSTRPEKATQAPTERNRTETKSHQPSSRQEAEPVRNNRTNYYGKTIGNSVRVTKQMRDKPETRSTGTSRMTNPSR